jgi:hypothetical protein
VNENRTGPVLSPFYPRGGGKGRQPRGLGSPGSERCFGDGLPGAPGRSRRVDHDVERAVAATHPLAQRGWINVTELENATWIVGEAGADGPQFGTWRRSAASLGSAARCATGPPGSVSPLAVTRSARSAPAVAVVEALRAAATTFEDGAG